ncbi:MAG: phosphodiester glycosidase family protein [Candidatus Latescibacteria bacterium]|nr:phosphodiester glycosidase family protein [Candidatus Latescibacterota bacterium]
MFKIIVFIVFAVTTARAQTAAPDTTAISQHLVQRSEHLAQGLQHIHVYSDSTKSGAPINIHILRAELDLIEVRPVLAAGQIIGQEMTSSMVKRHGALAGVNGGFSYSNNPWSIYHGDLRGFFVQDGQLISEPNDSAWAVQIKSTPNHRQVLSLVQPKLRVTFQIEGASDISCSGLNRERKDDDCIVYTPIWNRTTLADTSGVEVVVSAGEIKAVREGLPSAIIPPDGFVVSAKGAQAERLRKMHVGTSVAVAFDLMNIADGKHLPFKDHHYVSAGPLLVRGGKPVSEYEGHHWFHKSPFTHQRHPRTAIAWTENKREVMLVTVDGRQPDHSVGFTLPELADFLVKQGAHTVYNMDGGGSTTMAIGGEVVNHFSDVWGGRLGDKPIERRRCDALLLFSR